MKTTSERIKEALELKGMKQSDLVEKTGIGKSSISTYISGSYEPKQRNIYKIAKALGVNEAWLMGYDVPMERSNYEYSLQQEPQSFVAESSCNYGDNYKEFELLQEFNRLNKAGKNEAVNRVTELTYIPMYANKNNENIESVSSIKKYIPSEEDIRSLVARNGKKMTRDEAIEFISSMYSEDDE